MLSTWLVPGGFAFFFIIDQCFDEPFPRLDLPCVTARAFVPL
jgi:hypothetical protein